MGALWTALSFDGCEKPLEVHRTNEEELGKLEAPQGSTVVAWQPTLVFLLFDVKGGVVFAAESRLVGMGSERLQSPFAMVCR